MLLPASCPLCSAPGRALCAACASTLQPAPILPPPDGVDRVDALLAYEGAGRELVARIKYRNHRAVVPLLGMAMASLLPDDIPDVVVTWAPTTANRRRARGFDQAELLARAVARTRGWRVHRLVGRRAGPAQTGRTRVERVVGPRFDVLASHRGTVIVVDDVVTTGGTLTAVAAPLRAAGAVRVMGLAAARTPSPLGHRRDVLVPVAQAIPHG